MNYMNDLGASKCFFCSFFLAFFFVLENSFSCSNTHNLINSTKMEHNAAGLFWKFPLRQLFDKNMVLLWIKSFDYIHFTNYPTQIIAHMDFHWKCCSFHLFSIKKAPFIVKFDKKNIRWCCGTLCRYGSLCQRGSFKQHGILSRHVFWIICMSIFIDGVY